jgi:hypothetical protein
MLSVTNGSTVFSMGWGCHDMWTEGTVETAGSPWAPLAAECHMLLLEYAEPEPCPSHCPAPQQECRDQQAFLPPFSKRTTANLKNLISWSPEEAKNIGPSGS